MCRLYGFRANEATKVECSLVLAQNALLSQSRGDLRGKTHADGWGIAYYTDREPTVVKHETAAFDTLHFNATAERMHSSTVVAHVRRATVAGPSLVNTHPFHLGRWTFAHNGTVRAFDRVAAIMAKETPSWLLEHRHGATDSELSFLWLLGRLAQDGIDLDNAVPIEHLAAVVGSGIRRLAELCDQAGAAKAAELNFLLTNGPLLVAARWHNSLHWILREGLRDCEVCGIPHVHHDPLTDYRAVVVASEPISHEAWREVPHGSIVVVDEQCRATVRAF